MQSSVIHRISAGYFILIVCLIAVGWTGISRITSINQSLQQVTQEAMPIQDFMAEIEKQLSLANVVMYQHYNSSDSETLSLYEQQFLTIEQTYSSMTSALKEKLTLIDKNEELKKRLQAINAQTPEFVQGIHTLMHMHQSAFKNLGYIDTLRYRISQMETSFEKLHADIMSKPLSARNRQLMNERHLLIVRGIDLATMISLGNVKDMRVVQEWQKNLFKIGKIISPLRQNKSDLAELLNKRTSLLNELILIMVEHNRLIDTNDYYIKNKILTLEKLNQNEKILVGIRGALSDINTLLSIHTNDISKDAATITDNSRLVIQLVSLLSIVFGFSIAYAIVMGIRKPLNKTIAQLNNVEQGDLSNKIAVTRKDEFGQLQSSSQALNDGLREMILSIKSQADLISVSVQHTESATESTKSSMNAQKEQIEMVVSAIEELTSTTAEIASRSESALADMSSAYEVALDSQKSINNNHDSITDLQENMNHACDVIAKLDVDIHDIEDIVEVINSIAGQTNLLALNAAIEAARAGEQGRGFAVVADEVRTLAGRTTSSTEKIKHMINAILDGSRLAVSAIEKAQNRTDSAATQTQLIYQQIESVVHMLTAVKDLNLHIAMAAEQQSTTTEEVNRNMHQISVLSDESLSQAEKSRQRAGELNESLSILDTLVQKFKL